MNNDKPGLVTGLGFWRKASGRYCSHHGKLTKLDVEYLQSLKEGDRLVLYPSTSQNEKSPDLQLRRFMRDGEVLADGSTFKEKAWEPRHKGNNPFGNNAQDDDGI